MKPSESTPTEEDLKRDMTQLLAAVEPFQLGLDSDFGPRAVAYASEILQWNEKHNLLSRRDEANVIRRHISASLGVLLLEPAREGRWIDVGTGAGLPGMVVKISRPPLEIDLLDSLAKRCEFLNTLQSTLQLPAITVLNCRAEEHIANSGRSSYDVLTCKAVSTLAKSLTAFGPLVSQGGRFLTFKGPRWTEEMDEAEKSGSLKRQRYRFQSALRIPWTRAHLISLKKT